MITFAGREIPFEPGQSVAAALIAAGIRSWRTTRDGAARGLFCGIGACYDCLVTVNGEPAQRACLVPARDGDVVRHVSELASGPLNHVSELASGPLNHVSELASGPLNHVSELASEPLNTGRARAASPSLRGEAAGRYDVAVVGAGPAGLAAAAAASRAGQRVVLLDAGARPGGQYWRHRENIPPESVRYHRLARATSEVDYRSNEPVWFAEPGFVLHTESGTVQSERLVLATGAHDRVVPFPGWDLPGVTTAGGAQALLKGHGVLVGRRVVVAGTGPFLLPVAAGLARAGARVVGVFEANHPLRLARSIPLPVARLAEAAGYAAAFARHRIPYRTGRVVVAAHGDREVEAVTVAGPGSRTRRIECDALAVGYGFVPALELPLLLGCATRVDADQNLVVAVDHTQQTSVPGVFAAGEITGVGGAELAVIEGTIAGTGSVPPRLARRRTRLRRFARALHAVHQVPAGWPDRLRADTVVCRCEQVRYGRVEAAMTELGATDARTVKLLSRTGMGWCQGRICGFATACLAARLAGRPVGEGDLAAFAHRPIAAPITLGRLASCTGMIE